MAAGLPNGDSVKKLCTGLAALVTVLLGLLILASAAGADPASAEASFYDHVNRVRASEGKPPLVIDDQAAGVARAWSSEMARSGQLSHNPNLKSQVANWRTLGENVGVGSNPEVIQRALENSPGHRANMVNPEFTHVGIGVVEADGQVWVTEVFKAPRTSAPAAAPVVAPKPVAPRTTTPTRPRVTTPPRPRPTVAPRAVPATTKPVAKPAPHIAAPTTVAPAGPTSPAVMPTPVQPVESVSPSTSVRHATPYALSALATALLAFVVNVLRRSISTHRPLATMSLRRGRPAVA